MDKIVYEKHTDTFCGNIGMYYCGKIINDENHSYGPEIRHHYLLVLVENGEAVLYIKNRKIPFSKGDVLVMFPGERIHYKANGDWSIKWLGVNGSYADKVFDIIKVTPYHPVFTPKEYKRLSDVASYIYDLKYDNSDYIKCKTQSLLYEFFSLLLAENNTQTSSDAVDGAINIIKYNFNYKLNIKKIANAYFLDSAYFSRLFKKETGLSPKKYILNLRIEKAKDLLTSTNYSVKEISTTVGYADSLYFSKTFLKETGFSPTQYRKINKR